MSTTTSDLRSLAQIILDNVDAIDKAYKHAGLVHPSIGDLHDPESPAEKLGLTPEVLSSSILAVSAASQLVATLKLPGMTLLDRANAFHIPSALRIASETCVVELLREAGPQGMHAKDIAAKSKVDPVIMSRALRMLASHYVFTEIEPNVFRNNRISSLMDTNKSSDELLALLRTKVSAQTTHGVTNVQGDKYSASAVSALVDQCTDEVFKSSAFLPDVVLANDFSKTSFQKALQFDGTMWEFFEKNPGYLQRIQMAMVSWKKVQPQQELFKGFDWSSLPKGSLVVDVGGGNGSEAFEIAKQAPEIKIIIQDRDETIKQVTLPTWQGNPEQKALLDKGSVSLEAQDFFQTQPAHLAEKTSVFFLRFILHDWPAADCIKILKALHGAASAQTRVLLVEQLVPYACKFPSSAPKIAGLENANVPEPLLGNLGEANADVYITDFTMAALLNSQERTIGEFTDILDASGWKLTKVHKTVGSSLSQLECVKA